MTEKEKMLRGDSYDSRDPELITLYHRARKLLQEYNVPAFGNPCRVIQHL